jgi:uncharacterized protein
MKKKCLILGGADTEYHKFAEYSRTLSGLVTDAGAEAVCSEDCDALLAANLLDFDCVICCCSERTLHPDQEKSLLASIAGLDPGRTGEPKSFIGIHSASATFLNSDPYARMLGARFLSHPPQGDFLISCLHDELTAGMADFRINDELYLMEYYPPFTTLLETVYQGFAVPLAWKKLYGRGRVFYLAAGHGREQISSSSVKKITGNALKWALK